MPNYFYTGYLGGGKTLMSVYQIQKALQAGKTVATNLDINLEKLVKPTNRTAQLYRLPDKPTAADMLALGKGYEGDKRDEKKTGLIVLDEAGTWLNPRNWSDKQRLPLIDWCLHARKLRWDVIFIVQHLDLVDNQLRVSLCQHLVVCTSTATMKLPGTNLNAPAAHIATTYLGNTARNGLRIDRVVYRGKHLFEAYDTEQIFDDDYSDGIKWIIPPGMFYKKPVEKKGKHKKMIKTGMTLFLLITIVYMGYRGYTAWFGDDENEQTTEVNTLETIVQSGLPNIKKQEPDGIADYTIGSSYTYHGYVDLQKEITWLLEDKETKLFFFATEQIFDQMGYEVINYDHSRLMLKGGTDMAIINSVNYNIPTP